MRKNNITLISPNIVLLYIYIYIYIYIYNKQKKLYKNLEYKYCINISDLLLILLF